MGVKYGGLVKTNTIWLIGGLILTTIIGLAVFQESLTVAKIIGILLGLTSIFLLVAE
jgi:multidrug transporter EmrE-like cation transporter